MFKKAGFLFFLLLSLPALADTITIRVTPPNAYTDGTVLPLRDILEFHLFCNGVFQEVIPNPRSTPFDWTSGDLPDGDYTCNAVTVPVSGDTSDPSNEVTFSISTLPATPKANPPTIEVL